MNRPQLKCLIIDDEPLARKGIHSLVLQDDRLEFAGFAKNIDELVAALSKERIDLLFLDIEMPGVSGMEFVRTWPAELPMVIFITAFHQYAVESYTHDAADYLLKPVSKERFSVAVDKAIARSQPNKSGSGKELFLRHDGQLRRVDPKEVAYVSSMQNYVRIHLREGKPLIVRQTMKNLQDMLDPQEFLAVHKSYLINRNYIESVSGNAVALVGFGQIPIGRSYKDSFLSAILNKD